MRHHVAIAALTSALIFGACGSVAPTEGTTTGAHAGTTTEETAAEPTEETAVEPDDRGGFGAPSQSAGEFDAERTVYPVSGVLRLAETGCWNIAINGIERLVALPAGFVLDTSDAAALVGPDGSILRDGDAVDGDVRFFPAGDIPGAGAGRWGNYLEFCDPTLPELAVFDHLAAAFDPTTLSDSDRMVLLSEAAFTESWPCGRGWATSTADQRVGLVVYELGDRRPDVDSTIVLPDPAWTAEVVIGKHLFANHCNDAIEEWMPEPLVVARLPLGGTITIHDDVPSHSDQPRPVTATLNGAVVESDGATLELGTVELRNESYNAFAG